ncbi:MAG: hypothetical protein ACREO2_01645, partial [Arenimonas sp.]
FEALVTKSNFSPSGTLILQIPASDEPQTYTQTFDGQTYFVAEIPVDSASQQRQLAKVMGLLWDSSGSGENRNHDLEYSLLDRYFKQVGNTEVRLTRLRDRAETTESFRVQNGNWSALKISLENTVYDGASALSDWKVQNDVGEYLMFSDGLSNYGNAPFPALGETQRLFAINSAVSADAIRLSALAEQTGGRYVSLQPKALEQAAQALLKEGVHLESLDGDGLADLEFSSRDPQDGLLRVAGRMLNQNAKLAVVLSGNGKRNTLNLAIDDQATEHPLAANLWATYRLRSLDANHELNRAAIRRIGESFGLPSRETSLIVLDTVADYVRYEIAPPEELHAEYAQLISERDQGRKASRDEHLGRIVNMFDEKYAWWNKTFPKGKRPAPLPDKPSPVPMVMSPPAAIAADMPYEGAATSASAPAEEIERVSVTGARIKRMAEEEGLSTAAASISAIR